MLNRQWKAAAGAGLLLLITFVVYIPALGADFVWDDDTFLTANPLIHATDGLYRFWFTTEAPDYFPLTSTMLWVEWRLWGDRPAGYHAVNVLLHAISAILLWSLLAELGIPGAWLAGLLFAVHPVNVESVAWITERKNTLPMVFYLLSLLFFAKADRTGSRGRYVLSLLLFALALLAKTSVVMLPFVLPGIAWWRRGRIAGRDFLKSGPYFALALLFGLITVWFQYNSSIAGSFTRQGGHLERFISASWAVWFYLYKAVWPASLCFAYPQWEIDLTDWLSYVPSFLIATALVLLWRKRNRNLRGTFFALGYFLVTLLPILGFLDIYFLRYAPVADHWQYTAMCGIVAWVAGYGRSCFDRSQGTLRKLSVLLGVVVVGLLGMKTWTHAKVFRDEETLWRDTLVKNPESAIAHTNLGTMMAERGNTVGAIKHYQAALESDSELPEVQFNLGRSLQQTGRFQESVRHYREAVRMQPRFQRAHANLGIVLEELGDLPGAEESLRKALELSPRDGEVLNHLGLLMARLQRPDQAAAFFARAVNCDPNSEQYHGNLGRALMDQGEADRAEASLRRALKIDPNYAVARLNFAELLAHQERFHEAIEQLQGIIAVQPENQAARQRLDEIRRQADRNRLP